jgi:hypothetical protein
MMTNKQLLLASFALILVSAQLEALKFKYPAKAAEAKVGTLYPAQSKGVHLLVSDDRPNKEIIASGLIPGLFGSRPENGNGRFVYYYSDDPATIGRLLEASAREAIQILGFKEGTDLTLEIKLRDLRMQTLTVSNFSPVNIMAYGHVEARLAGSDGAELARRTFNVAEYESFAASKDPIGLIYSRVVWQCVAALLTDQLALKADPQSVDRLIAEVNSPKNRDQNLRSSWVTWLGFASRDNPSAVEKLFSIFRTDDSQSVYQAAASALARLGAAGAREEFEGVLSGRKKLKQWGNDDPEEVWHLIHALAILKTPDFADKVPAGLKTRPRLTNLIQFEETGQTPAPIGDEAEGLAKLKKGA